ncbi:winged helix-turn-helix domain-containing protein [Sphingomicrobium clamense]|uniref:Winged helix-turn-helix domain-containing protein n=1 Tax=Sphingomicrobium clamense TaxID=2851013 RepID=A0ABS6V6R4_9SPHN|nr:winged helix-turn-helix domain-containing protein [Sphingomicrobium sp. B8]MBW0145218.1 winged helix-turn-helix domain-containing protein [Sphingomicrobium sp. B8]
MSDQRAPNLSVGDYWIDRGDERVIGPKGPVRLGHKAYQVFCALADRRGRLLTKDALFETVWDGMFVSESALTTTIRELRRALDDDPRHPHYIESVYGRGYRIVATVEEVDGPIPTNGVPHVEPVQQKPTVEAGQPPRLAVAEFRDAAVQDRAPYVGATMREEILLGLSRFREIQVVDAALSVSEGSERDYRLDASFLPDAKGLKANVRLQRLGDGGIVWAETIPIDSDGLGAGVETIVRRIVGAAFPALDQDLSIGIGDAAGTLFDRYIVAKRQSIDAQDRATAEDAARQLEAIIAEKPNFALAYPPLVRLYHIDYNYTALGSSGPTERRRALDLAKAGLAADKSHVHSYTVLGFCHLYHEEYDQARSCFDHALERNPFNPERLNEVATGMTYLGDFDRARALFEQSAGIQPFADDASQEDLGRLALLEGDIDTAMEHFGKVTVASLWSQLCAAATLRHRDEKAGAKAIKRWMERVHAGWHRPIPPTDDEVFAWFRFHHPYKDDAGKPLIDLVGKALNID